MQECDFIEEISAVIEEIAQEQKALAGKVCKLPGRANLIEIMSRNHLENAHSQVLAFLLSPNEEHHHPEYGSIFLKEMQSLKLNINSTKIESVIREQNTFGFRRIDIFIQTEEDLILIENKIHARDQNKQIHEYLDWAKTLYGTKKTKNVVIIYLTLNGTDPAENSISMEELKLLKEKKQYISLSYSDLVDIWLNKLTTKANNELILQAALVQYIDLIKGLLNQRGKNIVDETNIRRKLFYSYNILNRSEMTEKLKAIDLYKEGILLSSYIKFLIEMKNYVLKQNIELTNKIFYYNKKQHFGISDETEKDWINSVISDPVHFGFGCKIPNLEDVFYITHFTSGNRATRFLSGVSTPTKNDKLKSAISEKRPDLQIIHEASELGKMGIIAAADYSNWAIDALLHTNGQVEWEKKQMILLSEHAVRYWLTSIIDVLKPLS